MSEMIELVARAICRQFEIEDGFSEAQAERHANSPMVANFRATARAAIEAMRKPTEAMDLAGVQAESYRSLGLLKSRGIWNAMITAALEEEKP